MNKTIPNTEQVELDTFPAEDKYYALTFIVPQDWLLNILERMDSFNNREGVDLQRFLDNYVWDETSAIYEAAKAAGVIIKQENLM